MSVEKRIDKTSGKVTYVARVYVGKKADGTPDYKSKSFDTKKLAVDYDNNYRNFKKNTVQDKAVSSKTLVNVVWDAYIKHISEKVKDNTIINYNNRYFKWIEPELGSFQIGNINLVTITNFKHRLEDNGASPKMVIYCLIVLKGMLEYASSGVQKYIIENPMRYYEMQNYNDIPTEEEIKYLNREEANRFFSKAVGCKHHHLLVFMANTGLRIAEAAALKPSDFNLVLGTVTVNHNLSQYSPKRNEPQFEETHYVLSTPKGHERRTIALSPMALNVAKLAIQASKGNYFVFTSSFNDKKKVIIKRGSKPIIIEAAFLNNKTILNNIVRICELAEVPRIGPHGLRHTFAANFLMNGGSLHALSKTLGHKSIVTTEIYAHLTAEHLKASTFIVNFGDTKEFRRMSENLTVKTANM